MTRRNLIQRALGALACVPVLGKWLKAKSPAVVELTYRTIGDPQRRYVVLCGSPFDALHAPKIPALGEEYRKGSDYVCVDKVAAPTGTGGWQVVCHYRRSDETERHEVTG